MIGAVTPGLREQPRERDLRRLDAALRRRFAPTRSAIVKSAVGVVQLVGEVVGLGANGLAAILPAAVAGEEAARQRAPRNHADALLAAERHHLALFLAVDQVVVVLHRDEPRPAVRVRRGEHLHELPREHARRADVARLARLDDVVERFEGFLDRRVVVEAMDLIEVDVVGAEPRQRARRSRRSRCLRDRPAVFGPSLIGIEGLGRDHQLIARLILQRTAEHLLADAARIHVGGVEKIDAVLERARDERPARRFVEHPRPPLPACRRSSRRDTGARP